MFIERTPNQIMNRIVSGTIIGKPTPDICAVEEAVSKLPIDESQYTGLLGVGDYDCGKSSLGSVVLGYENRVVAKIPLGGETEDAFIRSRRMQDSVNNFSNVAPETLIIIAKADGDSPKPIVLQRQVQGKPVCDTPIRDLFKLKTLYGIRDVVLDMKSWYWDNGCYDLCGQQTSNTILGKVIRFVPFFSDNVMVDKNGKVYLTDNILDAVIKTNTQKRRIVDAVRKNVLHKIPVLFIDSLIAIKKVYNFMSKNVENLDLGVESQAA